MGQRGNLLISSILLIVVFGLLGFGLYHIYKLNTKLTSLESTVNRNSSLNPTPSPTQNPSADWQEITFQPMNLKLKYPQGWDASSETSSIYQYPVPEKLVNENKIYNLIKITTHTGILIPGYYDIDLFEKIYNLKEGDSFEPAILNAEGTKIQNLLSGRITSGQKYTIFEQTSKTKAQTRAFILWGNNLIILDLMYDNNLGLTVLKEMLRTAVLL